MGKLGASFGQGSRMWLVILCVVFLFSTGIHAIRPFQKDIFQSHSLESLGSFSKDGVTKNILANAEETLQIEIDCDNIDEEECMNRRNLAAHTDYIYTQQHGKP
eukprot:Gb_37549 [translate_table: standard]